MASSRDAMGPKINLRCFCNSHAFSLNLDRSLFSSIWGSLNRWWHFKGGEGYRRQKDWLVVTFSLLLNERILIRGGVYRTNLAFQLNVYLCPLLISGGTASTRQNINKKKNFQARHHQLVDLSLPRGWFHHNFVIFPSLVWRARTDQQIRPEWLWTYMD